jgi:hypothetical protein
MKAPGNVSKDFYQQEELAAAPEVERTLEIEIHSKRNLHNKHARQIHLIPEDYENASE